jgi:xylose isomerase
VATANSAIDFLKAIERALDKLDFAAMQEAQEKHDAITALNLARDALFGM